MSKGKSWAPAGITSFFYSSRIDPELLGDEDLLFVGGYGGGMCLTRGVTTEVNVTKNKDSKGNVEIMINGSYVKDAVTTLKAIDLFFRFFKLSLADFDILVEHTIEVPIGAGFGTSAAGALSTILALTQALNKPLTYLNASHLAHVAEIRAGTGLGTISGITRGGVVLVEAVGAPGYDYVDRLIIPKDVSVIYVYYAPISKKEIIFSEERLQRINYIGKMALMRILHMPTLFTFLREAKEFMINADFVTPRLNEAIDTIEKIKNKIIGYAQNMIGEALHIVLYDNNVQDVLTFLRKNLDDATIFASKISPDGAKVIW